MKNLLLKNFVFVLLLSIFAGCSNDEDVIPTSKDIEVINNGTLLKFNNQATFDNYLSQENINIPGFTSMYDIFNQAMKEAESYYDRAGGYEEFKAKYSTLYFPEEDDDYSAYLPVSNKNKAKLLNYKGEVMINGEIINYTDISSYKQLEDLGIAPINNETPTMRAATAVVNQLAEVQCNDRKLWAKAYTRAGTQPGIYREYVVEVCFRKKGFLGAWYNYDSNTTLGWATGSSWNKSGCSSHDYLWPMVFNADGSKIPFSGTMYITFQGFGAQCGATKYYFDVNL